MGYGYLLDFAVLSQLIRHKRLVSGFYSSGYDFAIPSSRLHLTMQTLGVALGFVGNYAPCGLSPQTADMPVILSNHHFKWWFIISPSKGYVTARPKGQYRKHFYRSAIKRYFLSLPFSLLLPALLFLYCFICNITYCLYIISSHPKRFIPFTLQF